MINIGSKISTRRRKIVKAKLTRHRPPKVYWLL